MRRVLHCVAAVLATAVLGLSAAGPASAAYEQVRSWDADYPQPIAVDGQGNLVVGSNTPGDSHVTIYSPEGLRLAAWASPEGFNTITGIAVDAQARIYVTDLDGVQIFDAQGQRLDGGPIEVEDQTVTPFAIDIDARGDLYLTYSGLGSVGPGALRFSAAFQSLAGWGEAGAGPGQFSGPPLGVAANGRGDVYVADSGNDRVERFSDTGAFISQWGQLGSGPGQFSRPAGIALDAAGNVFVADEGNGRVQVFDPNGGLIDTVPIFDGPRGPESADPRDVAVAADGTLYVTETALFGRKIYAYRPAAAPAPPISPTPPPPGKPGGKGAAGATIASKSLRYRKGRIAVAIKCTAATTCRGTIRLLKGKTALGARKYKVKAHASATVSAKLTRRGRQALVSAKGAKLTVKLIPTKGAAVTKKLLLRP